MPTRSPCSAHQVLICGSVLLATVTRVFAAVDFATEIKPIIESACLHCHQAGNAEGDVRLDSLVAATAAGDRAPAIVPGDAANSPFYTLTVLPTDNEQIMPPDGPPLDESQTRLLRKWIEEGANWPASARLEVQPRIDFLENVQPILETHCLSCHSGENAESGFDLSTRQSALQTGGNPPSIVPFHAENSPLYAVTVVGKDDAALMPPLEQGGPLGKAMTAALRLWITQGAIWPSGVTLKTRPKVPTGDSSPDTMELVRKLHALIVQRENEEDMKFADYTAKIPQTGVPYEMVAIKGGDFLMGSPPQEEGRQENEGPQAQVRVESLWLGKHEVTWDEFEPFMITRVERFKNGARKDYDAATHTIVDAVSGPTAPYADMSFGMGRRGFPAICMTQHSANKYCQWLSAQNGHFYRLPTEAEWEYACRAGTTTAYSFGDDPGDLDKHAWYGGNSEEKSQPVGRKKPNPWGLHDMHGNVMEWTADKFDPEYFRNLHGRAENPLMRPESLFPRSVRGGSWNDNPEQLRSAYRLGSEPMWQQRDPQIPKSIWYLTDAPWLGFRIARPRTVPSAEEMYFYWNSSTGKH